jgi:hypothetical protein
MLLLLLDYPLWRGERAFLVLAHQPRISGDIGRQDGRQSTLDPILTHDLACEQKRRILDPRKARPRGRREAWED